MPGEQTTLPATPPAVAQRELSDFLNAEVRHTLGAYKLAEDQLEALRKSISGREEDDALLKVVGKAKFLNQQLRTLLHDPQLEVEPRDRHRHPSPFKDPKEKPNPDLLLELNCFYETAAAALTDHLGDPDRDWKKRSDAEKLGRHLAQIHDPQRRNEEAPTALLVQGRLDRTLYRLAEVNRVLKSTPGGSTPEPAHANRAAEILQDHIGAKEPPAKPLYLTMLEALNDAHRWMHQAEHLRSQSFGSMFTEIEETDAKVHSALERSIVLNTFVYFGARSLPWIFAENEEEHAQVVEEYDKSCKSLTPTYCLWIANQIGFLALERRAFTWWTMGKPDRAYRDFYKLTRLLRRLRRQLGQRAMRVPGSRTTIEGLTATAEHHIGRVYRSQHAHRAAVRYFDRASDRLAGWDRDPEISGILKNSRWRVDLLLGHGKASYELGRLPKSLLFYAQAWRAFLQLAESETRSTANLEVVDEVIEWLATVAEDPELGKLELGRRIEPLVLQFETVDSPVHLRLLAADIMMRLGHLLYILRLPLVEGDPAGKAGPGSKASEEEEEEEVPAPDDALARRCMLQAAKLDRTSTLIATDLMKISHRDESGSGSDGDWASKYPPAAPGEQWPAGGDRFEEAVRVIEYVIQTWLDASAEGDPGDATLADHPWIARELLRSFLTHTDSSNVKLAQVYRYLMEKPREDDATVESIPEIDVICLRRYSSFFPFLPRPAAFHALGGGYLVRVREAGKTPFGVAIDPGPHFLRNLYRCGYSLADVHMIVLTHDHADHIASLDALLALLGTRWLLGAEDFDEDRRLTIVGNESIVERYGFYNEREPVREEKDGDEKRERTDVVRVMSFERFEEISSLRKETRETEIEAEDVKIRLDPESLTIRPVKTLDHVDARGYVSQGFLLSIGDGGNESSVLFTSDTGALPADLPKGEKKRTHYSAKGEEASLEEAIARADVVVAHLSSVPLPELRDLAGLTPAPAGKKGSTQALEELWAKVAEDAKSAEAKRETEGEREKVDTAGFLLRQLQFAFRSRGEEVNDLGVSPLSPTEAMKRQPERHLYLTGLLGVAERMARAHTSDARLPLLLIGELREELGSFRTRIASRIAESVFENNKKGNALTADLGLRIRISRRNAKEDEPVSVLCTTCDLDNDLIDSERFHPPAQIREVCVKGENEGVFYNCEIHDPGRRPEYNWVQSVERYNVFGD
jgi:tetratricopeptide (TPR) repeat protein